MNRLRLALWVVLVGGFVGLGTYEVATWPDVGALVRAAPTTTAFIERYRAAERRAGREPRVAWQWVGYRRISDDLKVAVVVAEDIGFFDHDGFAREEIRQALEDAVKERRLPRGASTISQQLVKNLWLSPSRNPWRKVKEALLTRQLEARLEKRRILELYLNVVELGPGVYGCEAASRHYFDLPAAALSRHQAAALAAGLPRPRTWNPGSSSSAYRRRIAVIEGRMARAAWVRKLI